MHGGLEPAGPSVKVEEVAALDPDDSEGSTSPLEPVYYPRFFLPIFLTRLPLDNFTPPSDDTLCLDTPTHDIEPRATSSCAGHSIPIDKFRRATFDLKTKSQSSKI